MAYVLFHMWGPTRQLLVERHRFYSRQGRVRLLSQFDNIETEADKAAAEWLERASQNFNPDRDDEGSIYEAARDEGIAYYQLLKEMRDNVRLSLVAGMFHQWDKGLRDWMKREITHWHRGKDVFAKIWSQDIAALVDLFTGMGWDIRSKSYWKTLDACRLVVNVYKHGDGASFNDLKQRYPEYIENPLAEFNNGLSATAFIDYTNVRVTEDQINAFDTAIVEFWNDVPDNILKESIQKLPKWFESAWLKDISAAR